MHMHMQADLGWGAADVGKPPSACHDGGARHATWCYHMKPRTSTVLHGMEPTTRHTAAKTHHCSNQSTTPTQNSGGVLLMGCTSSCPPPAALPRMTSSTHSRNQAAQDWGSGTHMWQAQMCVCHTHAHAHTHTRCVCVYNTDASLSVAHVSNDARLQCQPQCRSDLTH